MASGKTEWSTWIELVFNANGTLDTTALNKVPTSSGVYATASKKSTGLYITHYVGRSSRNIRQRLQRHLSGNGNKIVASQLMLKRSGPLALDEALTRLEHMSGHAVVRIAAGEHGSAKRSAQRKAREVTGEGHATRGRAIEIRGARVGIAVAGERLSAELVSENPNHVGPGNAGRPVHQVSGRLAFILLRHGATAA